MDREKVNKKGERGKGNGKGVGGMKKRRNGEG